MGGVKQARNSTTFRLHGKRGDAALTRIMRLSPGSQFGHFLSLQSLRAFDDVEFHRLALVKGAIAIALNGTKMDKNVIIAFAAGDEAKTFGIVKPFNRAAYGPVGNCPENLWFRR